LNEKSSGSRSRKQRLTAVGTRCTDHVTPLYLQKLALTSPTGGGRSVGIVRVRTKATEFSLVFVLGISFQNLTRHIIIYQLTIKVKVNCSRYRPGMAQRVGRGIALLFHDRGTRRE